MSDTKKNIERPEIQSALEGVINDKLDTMGIREFGDLDPDHTRRTMRSLMRLAVKMGVTKGCTPSAWMNLAMECYLKETGLDKASSPEEAEAILTGKFAGAGSAN